jgi:hypothetical protein
MGLCFQCLWPNRFVTGVLAAKVLKTGDDPCPSELQSFQHEVDVLTRTM